MGGASKGFKELSNILNELKELDEAMNQIYYGTSESVKDRTPSKSGNDKVNNIIKFAQEYQHNNKHTANYMENKKAFEDALMDVINKYYDSKDNSCQCSHCHYEEEDEEYTEEEMEALYDDYYKSEGEYDNECNADCYVCKKPNKQTCSANDNSSKEPYMLVIKDQILMLGNIRKISWNIKKGKNTYLLGSGYYHRTIAKETTIEDVENIYMEVLSCFLHFKNPISNLNIRIIYNDVDITGIIIDNSTCNSNKPNTKLSDLM